jgi:predicted membrane protein
MNSNQNVNENIQNKNNSVKIIDTKLHYLTLLVLISGIILCIFDYKISKNNNYQTIKIALIIFIYSLLINCMTLGSCYYSSYLMVILLISFIIYIFNNKNKYDPSFILNKF